jgi:hypothetical protein
MGKIEWETRDASAPGVIGYIDVNDSNNFGTAFDMNFATGISGSASTKLTIKADGKVGIGTTSPQGKLSVSNSGAEGIEITPRTNYIEYLNYNRSTNSYIEAQHFAVSHVWTGNSGERARIDTSGRLLVGTSTSASSALLQIQGRAGGATNLAELSLRRDAIGISAGSVVGRIRFEYQGGGEGAFIDAAADGDNASNDYPTRLVFSVTADGASSPTEAMRINNDGSVWVGSTSGAFDASNHGFGVLTSSSVVGAIRQSSNVGATNSTARFWGTAGAAYIQGDGDLENTNNRYTGISDIKYKQNIEDASSQWDDIKAIQVRKYELIANPDRKHIGVIAQELEQICPGLVIERNEDDEGDETYKSVAYSVLYMKAVKALQEAMERIEVLEQRLTDAGIA